MNIYTAPHALRRALLAVLPLLAIPQVRAEPLDLVALGKSARPAVLHILAYDAQGREHGSATAFLVSSDGKLVTNFHVVEKAHSFLAKAPNGGLFVIESVLAADEEADLVVLKLRGKNLHSLTLADPTTLVQGQQVAVIGNPLGLEGTLSEGIISSIRESDGRRVLQISAAISPGSSGSPVIDSEGCVVGVAFASLVEGQSLNFATPVESVKAILARSEEGGQNVSGPTETKPKLGGDAWGRTRWGMLLEDIGELFGDDSVYVVPEHKQEPTEDGYVLTSCLKDYRIGKYAYNVFFWMDHTTRGLVRVDVEPDSQIVRQNFAAAWMMLNLKEQLVAKYGQPTQKKGDAFASSGFDWTWLTRDARIRLKGFGEWPPPLTTDLDFLAAFPKSERASVSKSFVETQRKMMELRLIYSLPRVSNDRL